MRWKGFLVWFLWLSVINVFSDPRPDSRPYISGDSFRSIANHVYDETTEYLDGARVKAGDIIFINLSHVQNFFLKIHPTISEPYILISHNHDYSAPGEFQHMLNDEKLIAWFTQNADLVGNNKLIPIPIGLSNKHWRHSREHDKMISTVKFSFSKNPPKKKILFYCNFQVNTNPTARKPVYDYFRGIPFTTWESDLTYIPYLKKVASSKFVLSPHGGGLDCHRTWESMYMGSYPVVKTSTLDPLYEDLPVLILQDWSELNEEFLEKKFEEFSQKKFNLEKLYFDYWLQKIYEIQKLYIE